jgi:hypothetical protein
MDVDEEQDFDDFDDPTRGELALVGSSWQAMIQQTPVSKVRVLFNSVLMVFLRSVLAHNIPYRM